MSSFINFPIAIVGTACRLPGKVKSLDGLWSVLSKGQDAVTEVPLSRWDTSRYLHPRRDMPGRTVTVSAGIVDDICDFDPFFFGISLKEAESMDPQQKLLLELTWEAFEDAGIPPSSVSGSDTAVFVGAAYPDAGTSHVDDICATSPYSMTGTNLSIISNRISYIFNFHGPSMTIDTACSSAMHALHQACLEIASGNASMAVAGGVNVLLAPFPFVGFSQAHMLSPGGRCRVFDASGDGYVRAEGGGIVILKPLKEAVAQGHHILGVIRGIGINSDGRTQGIALPSAAAQEELLRGIYETSGCSLNRLAYVEAHGTGTAVGDPIETSAIGHALGTAHGDPLWVGSVKCNVGHLETASAMAGLMKSLLVLRERKIPPQIHLNTINPAIDCTSLNLRFPLKTEQLPEVNGMPCVGINSFGFGGSNGHLILEAFDNAKSTGHSQVSVPPIFLSAKSEESLKKMAGLYADRIKSDPENYYSIASSAFFTRDLFSRRLVAEGETPEEVADALSVMAAGEEKSGCRAAEGESVQTSSAPVKTAFVFSGNGGQWTGMGRAMMANSAFAARAREVADLMIQFSGKDLLEILNSASDEDMTRTDIAQQLLFLVQAGLCAALEEVGIRADAAFGHSVGEVAAAWYCGAISLKDAVKIIYYRSIHQESTAGTGKMAAASVSAEDAGLLTERYGDVEIAGINASDAVTLSGDGEILKNIESELKDRHIFFKMLPLNYAFHSSRMDCIHDSLVADLEDIETGTPKLHFISSVTGRENTDGCPASYWWDNVRRPVNFHEAEQTAIRLGVRHFLEIGPHSILSRYLRSGLSSAGSAEEGAVEGWVGGTLSRNGGIEQFENAWRTAWTHGWPVDMSVHFPEKCNTVSLPSYPWNNIDCRTAHTPECLGYVNNACDHPLLGRRLSRQTVWENVIDLESYPWIADHKIGDTVYYPAAAFIEMALAAAKKTLKDKEQFALCNTAILKPIILKERQPVVIRAAVNESDGEMLLLARAYMRDEPWTLHAKARIIQADTPAGSLKNFRQPEEFGEVFSSADLYRITEKANMNYGPVFRPVDICWQKDSEILARFRQSAENTDEAWEKDLLIPPPLLDGGLQLLFPLIKDLVDVCPAPRLPYWFDRCIMFSSGRPAFALARKIMGSRYGVVSNLSLFDDRGQELLRFENGRARTVEQLAAQLPETCATFSVPKPHPSAPVPDRTLSVQELSEALLEKSAEITSTPEWQHYRDEILPLREMAALALARDLKGSDTGFRFADLTVRMDQYIKARGEDIFSELPSFEEIWRTLTAEAPEDSAVAMLLSDAHKTLLKNADPVPSDSPLWTEYRRQEYRADHLLCTFALEQFVRNASSSACIMEIDADQTCVGRITNRRLKKHARILTASCDSAVNSLQLACEGFSKSAEDAPVEVMEWNTEKESAAVKAHIATAFHCLHRADDIPAVLQHCNESLHDNGILILAESAPNITEDLLFGQDESWWIASKDSFNSVSRHLSSEEWRKALLEAGFEDIREIVADPAVPHFILIARKAGKNPQNDSEQKARQKTTWLLCSGNDTPDPAAQALDLLSEKASAQGDSVIRLQSGENLSCDGSNWICNIEDDIQWKSVWETIAKQKEHIVCIDALCLGGDTFDTGASVKQCSALLQMSKGWNSAGSPSASLRLLTVNALECPEDDIRKLNPSQAPVLGAARVLMNEMPALDACCIDMHISDDDTLNGKLAVQTARELLEPTKEREIILSGDCRYVLRSARTDTDASGNRGGSQKLVCKSPGHLETLSWVPADIPEPKSGEVRVKVHAVGLNFRDVMWAMNMLPEEALENGFSGPGLGIECAGIIDATGPDVTSLSVGQRVLCFGPQCFATHVLTTARAVTPIPSEWSFADAATVPVTFFTAWYAIKHLANMQPGERILIHGAAGGVGLAAIQIASALDLEVYATAGSEDKRHMLQMLGVEHIYDSRSVAFHDQILSDTGSQGVDAVLNSLAGEGIDQSIRLLRPFGRFLELGKRDFYADNTLRLRPFRNNISFFGIDVDQFIKERPSLGQKLFTEIMEHFTSGELRPLQYSLYTADEVENAFRAMQQSRHTGKIIVEPPLESDHQTADNDIMLPVRSDGTYIISGGLGGFGMVTAKRLAERGAGALVLIGRKGATEENSKTLTELSTLGLSEGARRNVVALAQDITDYDGLIFRLDRIMSGLPPLRGIIHAAAVLDDGMITDMTPERMEKVMAPKLAGAFNLHRYSLNKNIDFFVMYSSATTLLGNPGQMNYVAANMGLETLAALRRGMGLPGIAVGWGAIGDAGMLTRDKKALDSLIRVTGITPLNSSDALDVLEKLPRSCHPATAILIADWKRLSRLPLGRIPRFSPLRSGDSGNEGQDISLISMIRNLPPEKALASVTEAVTATVARIMRVPVSSIKSNKPLADMGMDSLMAVELVVALEERLEGQSLMGGLTSGASIHDIAVRIISLLDSEKSGDNDIRTAMQSSHSIAVNDTFADRVLKEMDNQNE